MKEDIFIVGMGIVTSLGVGKKQTMRSLRQEVPAVGKVGYLNTIHDSLPMGEVPYSDMQLKQMLGLDEATKTTRTTLLGRLALKEALEESRLQEMRPRRVAFISGTTVGGMEKSENFYLDFISNMVWAISSFGSSMHIKCAPLRGNPLVLGNLITIEPLL